MSTKDELQAEYERGWREGWKKAKALEEITTPSPMSTFDVGKKDGFNAAINREPNKYPSEEDES